MRLYKMSYTAEVYASIAMLAVFSSAGIIGNGLVLFGFSKSQQKLTSTVFILTLAGIDFITCLITIPFTIAMEAVDFHVYHDLICKAYHFLVTTTIPFSAFIMVAIAVDRYFCICHPFWKVMNLYRVRIIVICLGAFSVLLGILSSLNYGVYTVNFNNTELLTNIVSGNASLFNDHDRIMWTIKQIIQSSNETLDLNTITKKTYNTGKCFFSTMMLGSEFAKIYQRIYSSFYAICCVVVIIVYIFLYRFILSRRRRRLRNESFPCCTFQKNATTESENTEVIFLSHDGTTHAEETDNKEKSTNEEKDRCLSKSKNCNINNERTKNPIRAKQEKILINNIKTAFMLSIVACVFIFAFLPAWLMKYNLIPINIVLFHMYFSYNVANPFVYAFMNKDFRQQLKEICFSKSN